MIPPKEDSKDPLAALGRADRSGTGPEKACADGYEAGLLHEARVLVLGGKKKGTLCKGGAKKGTSNFHRRKKKGTGPSAEKKKLIRRSPPRLKDDGEVPHALECKSRGRCAGTWGCTSITRKGKNGITPRANVKRKTCFRRSPSGSRKRKAFTQQEEILALPERGF